jgi:hypothetical protein
MVTLMAITALTHASVARAFAQADQSCPLASDELVTSTLGMAAQVFPEYGVNVSGDVAECLFEGDVGLVLIARRAGFFENAGPDAFAPDQLDRLRRTREPVDYTPVTGVGDQAAWATIRDQSLAAERLSVLVVRHRADAYMFAVDDTIFPDALGSAKALALAVIAGQG